MHDMLIFHGTTFEFLSSRYIHVRTFLIEKCNDVKKKMLILIDTKKKKREKTFQKYNTDI